MVGTGLLLINALLGSRRLINPKRLIRMNPIPRGLSYSDQNAASRFDYIA